MSTESGDIWASISLHLVINKLIGSSNKMSWLNMKIILLICGVASITSGNNIKDCLAPPWRLKICEISSEKNIFTAPCSNKNDNLTVTMCNAYTMAERTENRSLLLASIEEINQKNLTLSANQLHLEFFSKIVEFLAKDATILTSNDIIQISKLLNNFLRLAAEKWLETRKLLNIPQRVNTAFRHILANAEPISMNFSKRMAIMKMNLNEDVQGAVATLMPKINSTGILRSILQNETIEELSNNDVMIILPKYYINNNRLSYENTSLLFEFYKSKDLFVIDDYKEEDLLNLLGEDDETEPVNAMIASFLISVNGSLIEVPFQNDPITVKFKYISDKIEEDYGCLAWTEEQNWKPESICEFKERKDNYITCTCKKTGTYTFTNDLDHYLEHHDLALDIIEHIGSSLSLPALAINIITYIRFKEWRKGLHHKTIVNLSLALFGDIIAMLNIDDFRTWKPGCIPLVAIKHFFLLAVIAWILIEAIVLYMEVSKKHCARFMQMAIAFGWGVPLGTVITIASIDYNLYYLDKHTCWMQKEVYVFGFIVPGACVLVLTLILITAVMRRVCCAKGNVQLKARLPRHCKTTYLAMTLFVITWAFFWIAVLEKVITMWYLHAVLYSLEGFLVFLLNFVAEPHVFKNLWCKGAKKQDPTDMDKDKDKEIEIEI